MMVDFRRSDLFAIFPVSLEILTNVRDYIILWLIDPVDSEFRDYGNHSKSPIYHHL